LHQVGDLFETSVPSLRVLKVKVSSGKNLMAYVFVAMFPDEGKHGKEFLINNYTSRSIVFAALIM
jgi:hypothetical protein